MTDERNYEMFAAPEYLLQLANDRIDRDLRHAAEVRHAEQARRRHRLPLRQRAANRLIQLGERLAAEPTPTPARSR